MRVITDRFPGWGRDKPFQVDLRSAQFNAQYWAEDFLGVEYSIIHELWPLWESAGPLAGLFSGVFSAGVPSWDNGLASFNQTGFSTNIPGQQTTEISIFAYTRCTDNGADQGLVDTKGSSSNWSNNVGWSINCRNFGASSGGINFKVANSETRVDNETLSDGALHSLVCSFAAGVSQNIYIDGDEVSYTANDVAGSFTNPQNYRVGTYYDGSAGRSLVGDIGILFAVGAKLNLNQIELLSDAPYALLMPAPRRVWSIPSVVGTTIPVLLNSYKIRRTA